MRQNIYHNEVKLLEQMIDYDILGFLPNIDIAGEGINPETLISETLKNDKELSMLKTGNNC